MIEKKEHLIVDAGNTRIKLALFKGDKMLSIKTYPTTELPELFSKINSDLRSGFISSVLDATSNDLLIQLFPNCNFLDSNTPLPIINDYATPNTLGKDRLCNVSACWGLNPNKSSLAIDIGTCIKYDFINAEGHYKGGIISPGIALRYKSLNDYTQKLPLLEATMNTSEIGNSTESSIHAGVMQAIQLEINATMERFNQRYGDLTFFMTGGDAKYFDFESKNNIFADENLTLLGLNQIFLFND